MEIVVRFSPCLPLIHICPCSCGSMSSGQRAHEVMTVAFSRDMGSAGNPSFFHAAFMASVVRIFNGSMPSVIGIFFATISGSHMFFQRSKRSLAEKAPMYDTKAEARSASPITDLMLCYKYLTSSFQRLFSPAKPLTSFSAEVSFA